MYGAAYLDEYSGYGASVATACRSGTAACLGDFAGRGLLSMNFIGGPSSAGDEVGG